MQDRLRLSVMVPLGAAFYASAAVQGMLWSTRERELLGGGLNAEANVAWHALPVEHAWRWDLRLIGSFAPRYPRASLPDDLTEQGETVARWLIPEQTAWFGAGAALGHGDLSVAPFSGRRVSLLLDGSCGWLLPQSRLGYYAEGGFGFSPFGADLLAFKGRVGNVVGTAPGTMTWGALASYQHSLW
jgi:hypothetical protein